MGFFDCCQPANAEGAAGTKPNALLEVTTKEQASETTDTASISPSSSRSTSTSSQLVVGTAQGPREEDVDALVGKIMKDSSINIPGIPDAVERMIYKSTIQLTLNVFYSMFSNLEGAQLLACHQIQLNIVAKGNDEFGAEGMARSFAFPETQTSDVDDQVLEDVASRLLANKAINQRLLPDQLEHLLYTNCLKVIFQLLNILTKAMKITICGHDIGLFLEPTQWQELLVQRSEKLSSSPPTTSAATTSWSDIDQDQLQAYARQKAGITEELDFWNSLFVGRELVAQLHASLYGLLLGILDDMLATTKIEIMSHQISLDIVPASTTPADGSQRSRQVVAQNIENEVVDFETERKAIVDRFKTMTPEQRAILVRDLLNVSQL